MFRHLHQWWLAIIHRRYYIIADARDNSVTFSRRLYRRICKSAESAQTKVMTFRIPDTDSYGFAINPALDQETQLADIQYNAKYKTIGFEALCPTVNRIFYDYGLPAYCKACLSVSIRRTPDGSLYYLIEHPTK
ncbi:MAG: hypothetical protein NC212_08545 [Staphylococcus sp.]|nr:hypothetical protein [Staphylococcus sp.]